MSKRKQLQQIVKTQCWQNVCHIFYPFACYQIMKRKCLLNLNVILKEIKKLANVFQFLPKITQPEINRKLNLY